MIFYANSTDRVYNDNELNAINKLLFETDGVFNTKADSHASWEDSGDFKVSASGGNMTVLAESGLATVDVTIDGDNQQILINEPNQLSASVSSNVSGSDRNDAVVLRVDESVINNDNLNQAGDNAVFLTVVSGSDSNPLTDSEISTALSGDPFIRLADVLVPSGTSEITDSMITDRRSRPQMTRSVDIASDTFTFYELPNDPDSLIAGMVWYNSTEEILKFYDGENTVSLQTQTFDWGYYPPDGVDNQVEIEPIAENDSDEGQDSRASVFKFTGNLNDQTAMVGQLFEMPNISNPYFRIRIHPNQASFIQTDMNFRVYSVDGNNQPDTEIEDLGTLLAEDTPVGGYQEFFTSESYTPGEKYMIVVNSVLEATNINQEYSGTITTSEYDNNDVFLGYTNADSSTVTDDPTTMSWDTNANRQFKMEIADVENQEIGETDSSGNFHEISQSFVAKSRDISYLRLIKGADVGSPTGSVTVHIYETNDNDEPTGNSLASASISATDWGNLSNFDNADFQLSYDSLVEGEKYAFVIETENNSDTDNYTVIAVPSSEGEAKRRTTAEGWTNTNTDILFYTLTSPVKKIPVTNAQGKIPHELLPKGARVKTYTTDATPEVNIENYDAVYISALSEAITDVTVTGGARDFQELKFRINNQSGSSKSITWGSQFEDGIASLPTSVANGNTLTVWFEYDSVEEVWEAIVSGSSGN